VEISNEFVHDGCEKEELSNSFMKNEGIVVLLKVVFYLVSIRNEDDEEI
jgi:hypothetical protein